MNNLGVAKTVSSSTFTWYNDTSISLTVANDGKLSQGKFLYLSYLSVEERNILNVLIVHLFHMTVVCEG